MQEQITNKQIIISNINNDFYFSLNKNLWMFQRVQFAIALQT